MLTWVVLAAGIVVLWLAVGRPRAKSPGALREAGLAILAAEKGLRWIEGDEPYVEAVTEGVPYRVFAHSCGFEFDVGVTLCATTSASAPSFAAWPRDPPESIATRGREVPTGDSVFDARFAVVTDEPEPASVVLDEGLRRRLLSVGAPALVSQEGKVWLLLPAVPPSDVFDVAASVISRVVRAIARSQEPAPYR
jgi:hypothetical protein